MAETFLLILAAAYLVYRIAFVLPGDIKRLEGKVDNLHLQLLEMERRLESRTDNY